MFSRFSPLVRCCFVRNSFLYDFQHLLLIVGRQLVESQYKKLTFEECGCGKVRHFETPTYGSEKSSELQDNMESGSNDDQLAVRESTHLEWRKKPEHPRWVRVRALCGTHKCPFTPTTMFQFHRHLEQGHQRMWRCSVRRRREPSPMSTELPPDLTLPLIISPHVRSIQRVTCPVCPDFRNTVSIVVEHIDRYVYREMFSLVEFTVSAYLVVLLYALNADDRKNCSMHWDSDLHSN